MKRISDKIRGELEKMLTSWMQDKGILPANKAIVVDLRAVQQRVEKAHVKINVSSGDLADMMKDSIAILCLSRRPEGVLVKYGYDTIGELFNQKGKLALCRGMGKRSYLEVRNRLQDFGFKLDEGWRLISNFGPDDWMPDR